MFLLHANEKLVVVHLLVQCVMMVLLCLNYSQVTEADIEDFEAKYRGSDSEKKDLKDLYTKFKGKMNR